MVEVSATFIYLLYYEVLNIISKKKITPFCSKDKMRASRK